MVHPAGQTKDVYRKKILEKRKKLSQEQITETSNTIMVSLFSLDQFIHAKRVAFYLPVHNEVNTKDMITALTEKNIPEMKEILVPVTTNRINLFRFTGFDNLRPAKYGVMEPAVKYPPSGNPDVILLPGIAFGLCMHRIGYGKGYYDDLLKRIPKAFRIGLAYDFQILDALPKHENDEKTDAIITEKRIINRQREDF